METRCKNHATFRYTWPGKDESFACLEHAAQLQKIASILGMYLQIIPIVQYEGEIFCTQIVSDKNALEQVDD
jgi:hypothetical protein